MVALLASLCVSVSLVGPLNVIRAILKTSWFVHTG